MDVPNTHEVEARDKETGRYSAAFEFPVPVTAVTSELAVPPIVPAVSVTEV